ncbi:hypothetical protein CRM22_001332 [Opisthorchis felineus]|uniref:Uncharacterized protein n=1 Tax=Opisthorchis felineus TaxID=147828 RepID=A0A4S2MB92_OPIFE|nr:hypothetical protein CRM22_001332 [Opisthorchis felineus]
MSGPPLGFGWATQQDFPASGQTPYGVPEQPYATPGFGQPATGWQSESYANPDTSYCPPPAGGIGFDFMTNNQPSAPPVSPNQPFTAPSQPDVVSNPTSEVEAARTVRIIPAPKGSSAPAKSPVNVLSNQSSEESDSHRSTSRYQEGLRNMADLMTDVDLTEDVMGSVKNRFDLNR